MHMSLFGYIRDGYNSKKVTFDMQNILADRKISLPQWWANWQLRVTTRINSLNPRFIKADRMDNQEIIMTRVIIKMDIDWIVEIGGYHSEVEVSMDKIIGKVHNVSILIELTLGETIL